MSEPKPAEVFAPGEYIPDELAERGWTVEQLAVLLGCSQEKTRQLIAGECKLTLTLAHRLSKAFGTSIRTWLRLEKAYRRGTAGERE